MKDHTIAGGGGTQLHLVETGNPSGRTILFLHGFSQCWRCWGRQMNSDLAHDFRLIAMDIRGHGLSDKPRDAYADPRLWADDVNATIQNLKLDHPILCGWSYGPFIILDYIRNYGEGDINGIVFVGGITKLGSEEAISFITPEFLALMPGFFATDTEECRRSLKSLLQLCLAQGCSAEELEQMLEYNLAVPAHVRQALFSRSLDNDDVLARIRKPALIVHGEMDAVVKPAIVEKHKAALPHAKIQLMPNAGHAASWDDAAAFNQHLRDFAAGCESAVAA